ncbi:unnamed protein product [Tuber aestivum]|uniref:Uncharacterized protein n=1 Tax=Tuber aestivum TaxID=59557 RepID=A0A292PU32_9PEZI|nr:unnamed protein product [Tuber aestivum]
MYERSAKSYDTVELAKLFPGATPKAIEERIAKLKREAKAMDNPSATTTSSNKNRKRGTAAGAAAATSAGVGGPGGKKRPKTAATVPLFVPGVCGGNNDDEEEDKKRFAEVIISADVSRVGVPVGVGESTEDGEEVPADIGPVSPGVVVGMGLGDDGVVKPDPWVKEELVVREIQEPYIDNNSMGLVGGLILQPEENWPIKPEMVE